MKLAHVIGLASALLVAGAAVAHGRAPTSADPDLIEWFQNQHKANGAWCCDHADGHILGLAEWTYRDGAYWVLADGRWVQVDERQNLAVTGSLVGGNPTGGAVAWWVTTEAGPYLYCFVPPDQG